MAIQLIDTATPQVGLKGGAEKINANFTDAENAASRLVGTNPENVPLNSDLPDFGTAATKNTGTGSDQIPLNSDLGNASLATVQTSATDTTAGALMAVGAFGLGGLGPTRFSGDVDTVLYGVNSLPIGNTATNTPVSESGILTCAMWDTDGAGFQTFHSVVTEATYVRRRISNSWSDWKRIDPQAFGLGGDAMPSVDWNDPQTTQAIVSNVNGPNGAIGFLGFNTKSGGNSVAFAGRNSEFYARTIQDGTPQAWQPVYTGSNLNPNEFGGLASGDVIAIGYAESATIAVFNLPISSTTAPSSVTITGTFEIRAGAGFTARATGISSGSFVTPATTSNKYFVLGITGLSGLTIGETLLLRTESASSKITVNL